MIIIHCSMAFCVGKREIIFILKKRCIYFPLTCIFINVKMLIFYLELTKWSGYQECQKLVEKFPTFYQDVKLTLGGHCELNFSKHTNQILKNTDVGVINV
jgi:hypothetical protein